MAVDIGPRIGIEGEAEYRRQINQIITQSKTLSSEMRVVASSFTAETTAEEKAAKTAEVLSKQVDTQKDKVKLLSDQLEKAREKYGDNSEKTLKWQQAVNNATADLNKMERELADTQKVADGYGQEVDDATKSTQEFDQTAQLLAKQQLAEFWSKAADAARKVADAAMNAAKELDKGYDTIAKKTGKTGEELEELKGIANDVYGSMAEDMSDVGAAVGEVSTRLGLSGDELRETSELFLKFAHINDVDVSTSIDSVQKALAAFGLTAQDTERILNVMTAAGQDSGVGMNELSSALVKNAGALTELGLTAEQAIMFIGRLEKSGVDSETALSGMSRALKNATKQGIPLNQALENLEDTILDETDGVDGLTTAYDLFGKSGDKIYNALKTGSISFKNLTGDVKDYADVVENTYKATISPWDETKVALNNLKTVGSELAGMALQTLVPAIQKVTNVIKGITEWFQKLSPTAQKVVGVITALAAGAAILGPKIMTVVQTMSMFKAASLASAAAQAAQTAATAAQTTATVGATAAQDALNASMWANPVTWLIAGIAALTAALVVFGGDANEAYTKVADLHDEVRAASDAFEENRSAIQDEQADVKRLTDRVKELNKKEKLNTAEKTEMAAAVQKLNGLMPDLNLQIDNETGKLKGNTEALEKNFDAALALYNLQKNQERMTSALETYTAQREAANKAEQERNALQAQYDAAVANYKEGDIAQSIELAKLKGALDESTKAWADATTAAAVAENEYNALIGETEELSEAQEEAAKSVGETADAVHEATNRIQYEQTVYDGFAKSVIQAYEDMKNAVANSIESQISWLDKYEAAQTVNADTIEQNLTDQIKGVEDWQENIVKLADMGINQGLLKYLMDMGPKGAGYIKGLVEGGADQLGRINKLWADAMNVQGLATETGTEMKRVIQGLIPDFESLGYNAGAGFASGLTKSQVLATQAASAMAHASIDTSKNILGIASPSKVFEYFGEMVGEGFEQGISATMPSMNGILSPWNDVGMFSGRGVNSLDPDAIYSAVRNGAENAQTKIIISGKEFGRLLRGMGVAIA